jgi:photosystem II stability/assembly factor-like uncharacterized protein
MCYEHFCKRYGYKVALVSLTWLLFSWFVPSALAGQEIYALNNAGVSIRDPSTTTLIAITRVGQRLVAVGLHGAIILSDDDGVTWKQAKVPVDLTLTDVYFASDKDGWAVGHYGIILQTTDGGSTWAKALTGRDVIAALNDIAKQAKTDPAPSAADTLAIRVANAYQNAGPSKPFLAIGNCGGGLLAGGQQDLAMFSSDSGKNWQLWTLKINEPNFLNIYAMLNLGSSTFLIGEQGLVLESDGGCTNFKPISGPFTGTLFGGLLVNSGSIFVYGLDGAAFRSDDKGQTWQTISMPGDATIVTGVVLSSGQVLLGTLEGKLFLSDKGVKNFQTLSISEPFQIAAMTLAPNGNLVVVGNGGVGIVPSASIP